MDLNHPHLGRVTYEDRNDSRRKIIYSFYTETYWHFLDYLREDYKAVEMSQEMLEDHLASGVYERVLTQEVFPIHRTHDEVIEYLLRRSLRA